MGARTALELPSKLSFTGVFLGDRSAINAVQNGIFGHIPLIKLPRTLKAAVDIGANIGSVAIPLALLGATVHCYEPVHQTLAYLIENAQTNNVADRLFVYDEAVGATTGQVELRTYNLDRLQPGMTSGCYDPENEEGSAPFSVKKIGVNNALARVDGFIDFLKIDIEGMEHEVVPAILDANWARIGMIDLEVHHFNHAPYFGTEVQLGEILMAKGFKRIPDTQDCGWVRI